MKNSNYKGIGCVVLFVTPFFVVGCVTTFLIGKHIVTSLQMQRWTTVDATVLSAGAHTVDSGDDGKSCRVSARYTYVFDGQAYSGDRAGITDQVGFGGTLRKRAALLQEAQRAGLPVGCYVNPRNPAEAVLFPGVQWDHVFFLSIFSLVFGGVGVGGYGMMWFGRRKLREREMLESQYPGEPWRWRPEWDRGVIPAGSKATMVGLWAVAGFWNAISAPVPFAIAEEWQGGNSLMLLALLFPLVGAGLLIAAVRATLIWLKYGRTELVMRSVPGVIGGELIGAVRIPQPVDFDERVTVKLSCIKKVTSGSGDDRSTSEHVLWQSEHQVDRTDVQVTQQTLVPVVFLIPYTCRPTDEASDVSWRLEAAGATPGLDFQARIGIPVFQTAESREEVTEHSTVDPTVRAERMKEAARSSLVGVRELGMGRLELDVPPAAVRSVGMFLSLAAFTIFWTAVCVGMVMFDVPILFPIVFGLLDLLLWLILLQLLTGRTQTRIGAGEIAVSSRFLCFWSRRTIPAADVHRVEIPVTSRAQSGSRQYLYYSVRVFYGGSEKERHFDVADSIGNKAEAEWIAEAVENALLNG